MKENIESPDEELPEEIAQINKEERRKIFSEFLSGAGSLTLGISIYPKFEKNSGRDDHSINGRSRDRNWRILERSRNNLKKRC